MAKLSNKEKTEYTLLTDHIQELYLNEGYDKSEIPWNLLTAQIKNYKPQGYTYAGISLTLDYMITYGVDIFNGIELNGSILNLIPFYYTKARNEWMDIFELSKNIQNFDFTEKTVVINKTNQPKKELVNSDF